MNVAIENMARNGNRADMQWFIGKQLPQWIRELLRRKREGEDCGKLIDEFAAVCCIKENAVEG